MSPASSGGTAASDTRLHGVTAHALSAAVTGRAEGNCRGRGCLSGTNLEHAQQNDDGERSPRRSAPLHDAAGATALEEMKPGVASPLTEVSPRPAVAATSPRPAGTDLSRAGAPGLTLAEHPSIPGTS